MGQYTTRSPKRPINLELLKRLRKQNLVLMSLKCWQINLKFLEEWTTQISLNYIKSMRNTNTCM